ncbi:MAG: aminoglycoside 6-adenylyltransferase [Armatimonadota bacterium]|nr:MAG: aminoglycoside 6-adenylyltransferase [Armatimonadota bacterium]
MRDMGNDVINRLIAWAAREACVRVMLLTSSRAGSGEPVDPFSDYDVILYVSDTAPLIGDDGWLRHFGTILVMCRTHWEHNGTRQDTRLVRYDDGTRIDFTIAPVRILEQVLEEPALPAYLDIGYRVLLDKDDLTGRMLPPSYQGYIPRKPTEHEFQDLVQGFWWDSTYVAKYLWRDDLFPAKYMLDCALKFDYLRRMLEWSIEIEHNWSLRPGSQGRYLKQRLPSESWSAIEATFVGADIDENWRALFRTCEVFRETALGVARHLGYEYPRELDANVTAYLRQCMALENE